MPRLRAQYLVYVNTDLAYISSFREEAYAVFKETCEKCAADKKLVSPL